MDKTETIELKLDEGAMAPSNAYIGDSGYDVISTKEITLEPFETALIPTGVYLKMPNGIECQVRARSGNSLKTPLRVANGIGTIDASYTGHIQVIMQNVSNTTYTVNKGMKIAQLVFAKVSHPNMMIVDEFTSTTERGKDGFGSTDI